MDDIPSTPAEKAKAFPAAPGVYLARLKGTRTQATHHIVLMQ